MPKPLRCFIIMPFHKKFIPVRDMIKDVVCDAIQGTAIRADDIFEVGEVVAQVRAAIEQSDFCVADITGNNPNVMWEIGYARALGKSVVVLRQHSEQIPFDVRTERFFKYSLADLTAAKMPITRAIKTIESDLANHPSSLSWRYDELTTLRDALSRCQPTQRGRNLLTILCDAIKNSPIAKWRNKDERRLMQQLAATSKGDEAQNSFWWLVAHGVLSYDQIECFQIGGSNGWRTNLELVELSSRGMALLNCLNDALVPQ